jgi:hypothetical protein
MYNYNRPKPYMNPQIVTFNYRDQEIEFLQTEKNVMVNATEMAKIFAKKVENFTRSDQTIAFIEACLKNANQRFLNIEKKSDLIYSKQKSGTWMHRVLALKFASWLSPDFELWVYRTIEEILFGSAKQLAETNQKRATLRNQMNQIHLRLLEESADYRHMMELKKEDKLLTSSVSLTIKNQLSLFTSQSYANRQLLAHV